jgi:sugar lactone lactonase YvrE
VGGLTSDSTHLYIISGLIIKKIRQTDMGEVWSYTGFTNVVGIAVNKSGTIYVTGNNNIYKIPSTGGSYQTFVSGLYSPKGISVGKNDYIYVADTNNHVIRQITPDGTSSIIAGDLGIEGFEDKISSDGPPAQFRYPTGIYVDQNDNIFVTDQGNKRVRLIDSNRFVMTIAGTNMDGFTNTNPLLTSLSIPTGITMDASNNLYVVETGANRVQKMNIVYTTLDNEILAIKNPVIGPTTTRITTN